MSGDTFGSLFSGIGGLDLGLERAGWKVRWHCEVDPFCRRVLITHWPDIPCYEDVRSLPDDVERVELVCGGFPCQNVSDAGDLAGIEGERSGLWADFASTIRRLRPRYVLVENVTGLLARGMGRVIGDLAASGYDAEWDCVPSAAVGAPHLRARLFILAYARGDRGEEGLDSPLQAGWPKPDVCPWWTPEPDMDRVAHGLPAGMGDRLLHPLGNAVVPQVAEWVGRRIIGSMA